jgi:hypothetical protein
MHTLSAPDWRDGVPYQPLLEVELRRLGVEVSYLRDYRRGLPLWRLVKAWRREHPCDLLHLHWPEAYYPRKGDGLDWFRFARFPLDLWLATRGLPLAVTAHNLQAHNRSDPFAGRNTRAAFRRAGVVFAHSATAQEVLEKRYGVARAKIQRIENGDLTAVLEPPLPRAEARVQLGLGAARICLMFGAVEPYKGIEEVISHWDAARFECELHIVGKPCDAEYEAVVQRAATSIAGVHFRPGWLSDADLRTWLSATDCVLFNYRSIFNSGSAPTARGYGVPALLPERLTTVQLDEPHPTVVRFRDLADDFPQKLQQALGQAPDYAGAAHWREMTSWKRMAELTVARYRQLAGQE